MIRGGICGLLHPVAGPTLKHSAARCVRCTACVKRCPGNALALDQHKQIKRFTEACWGCLRCLHTCPEGAHRPHFSRLCLWLDRLGRRTCVT
jgi:ferredoxin